MTSYADAFLQRLTRSFEQRRDPERATQMAAYMRNQFAYFGIGSTERMLVLRGIDHEAGRPSANDLRDLVTEAWHRQEREFQYAAVWLLRRHSRVPTSAFMPVIRAAITKKSWWDTVDELAVHIVGGLVRRSPGLRRTMDQWSTSDNIWLARAAILHQNRYRRGTDAERLFAYCARRGSETEFFIRKAIGWALREYSKTDGRAVVQFIQEHGSSLSGLSRREALKWLDASRA